MHSLSELVYMPAILRLIKIKGQGPIGDLLIKMANHQHQKNHQSLAECCFEESAQT